MVVLVMGAVVLFACSCDYTSFLVFLRLHVYKSLPLPAMGTLWFWVAVFVDSR